MLPGLDRGYCIPPETCENGDGSIASELGPAFPRVDGVSGTLPIIGVEVRTAATSVINASDFCPLLPL